MVKVNLIFYLNFNIKHKILIKVSVNRCESDCKSRCREFKLGLVQDFRGD